MTRDRTLPRALLAVLLVLGLGVVLAVPAGADRPSRQADEEDGSGDEADEPSDEGDEGAEGEETEVDPFDRLAGCVGASGRLLVVLLVDESASLRETDPDDQRVVAAQVAVESLDRLREGEGDAAAIDIDVLVSAFSFDFAPVGEWTPLTEDTRAEVDEQVASLADRDASMDTDFHNALDGARRALADRATETTAGAGGEVCKSILLFTDGNFVLGARDTPEKQERYGLTKDYAPDIELVDMSSRLRTIDDIMDVTTKPIILDGDTGGLVEHFVYNVRTLERMGVSAVIIEDKTGLKKNSLFGTDVAQTQDTAENFSAKIAAGKKAKKTDDFMIIARCESLILEQGMDDALLRTRA